MTIIPFVGYLIITHRNCDVDYSTWDNIDSGNLKFCCYYDGMSGIILYDGNDIKKENFTDIKPFFNKVKFKEALETLNIII